MKLLFDTHILLWALIKPGRLPTGARLLIEDEFNEPVFSAASQWSHVIPARCGTCDTGPKRAQTGPYDTASNTGATTGRGPGNESR